jgi:hypothetical protein
MPKINTASFSFTGFNITVLEVGTNCPQGGDSGHGGRTIFRISDEASTDLRVRINDGIETHAQSVEIVLGGDSECASFIELLENGLAFLKNQYATNAKANRARSVD